MDTCKKKWIRGSLIAVAVLLAVVLAYVLYVVLSYSRIPDNTPLTVEGTAEHHTVSVGETYTAVSQNLGFGAYTADFTFFMDGGKESRAASRESAEACINAGADKVSEFNPDFILFQEVDLDSTRSHHLDQYKLLSDRFDGYSRSCAVNYDSAYLMYPLTSPHGASKSSLATFSRFSMTASLRRSFPISTSFSKFLDLDRCYSVSRIPTDNGKELVIYNVHASAYGGSDKIRTAQMTMLLTDMSTEYKNGNYVVCGGDFNHDFTGDSTQKLNGVGTTDYGWAQPFPDHLIPDGISKCVAYRDGLTQPTCRNCDVPYEVGNFTIIVDGFLVSDNVECVSVENIVTDFVYSDHNPVVLQFRLK